MMNPICTLSTLDIHRPLRLAIGSPIAFRACPVTGTGAASPAPAPAPGPGRPVRLEDIRFAAEPVFDLAGLAIIAIMIGLFGPYALFC
ncbi:MAG: hypothetical protein GC187_02825 [Alphaproteobacteria bacterium]|nr:hypothetical protein [Alphaproteobacteria bacterium]